MSLMSSDINQANSSSRRGCWHAFGWVAKACPNLGRNQNRLHLISYCSKQEITFLREAQWLASCLRTQALWSVLSWVWRGFLGYIVPMQWVGFQREETHVIHFSYSPEVAEWVIMGETWALEPGGYGFQPWLYCLLLCSLGRVTWSLWTSGFSPWTWDNHYWLPRDCGARSYCCFCSGLLLACMTSWYEMENGNPSSSRCVWGQGTWLTEQIEAGFYSV